MAAPDYAQQAVAALNNVGVGYMLVGSFSSMYYGVPRFTKDADFVIQSDDHIDAIREALTPMYRMDEQLGFETKFMTTKFVFRHRDDDFTLELFLLSSDEHDQERFRRRVLDDEDDPPVYLPTVEDVIIQKLRWKRLKDRQDVRDILEVQADQIDWDYVHHWCDQHGTLDVLKGVQQMEKE